MLKLAVFVALVAAASAAGPLGADPCTYGPSFWCDSMDNAQKCGAVAHCQALGLLNENAPLAAPKPKTPAVVTKLNTAALAKASPNGVECDICTFAVKAIDTYLSENSTETEIIDALNDLCSHLGSEASVCKIFVSAYGDELVQYIIGLLSVTDICNDFLHVCSAETLAFVHRRRSATLQLAASPNDDCDTCKAVVTALDSALESNSTVTAILDEIEKICSDLGPLEGACKDFINTEGPRVIDYLVGELQPDTVCHAIGLCPSTPALSQTKVLGGEKCTYGPSYWCTSKDTAAACQQTEFCLRVWAKSNGV